MTTTLDRPAGPAAALRMAFAAPAGPDVFGGVVHANQLWAADPFDVPELHPEARAAFARLLGRTAGPAPPAHGAMLLLLGEAGSGKTHLLRAFRHTAHGFGTGYCGYLQMRTRTDSYARYLLGNLLTALEQPYRPGDPQTGLDRLARGLLDALDLVPEADRRKLWADHDLEPAEVAGLVHRFADAAVQDARFRGVDVNVLRAVLLLLPSDGRIRPRALNWLRCEDLGGYDRALVADLVPRPQPEMPMATLLDLGRLMHAVHGAGLVLLVDQIDEALSFDRPGEDPGGQFRAAVTVLNEVAEKLPTAVVVIGCLEAFYEVGRQRIPGWLLDRVSRDPAPVRLAGKPTADQLAAIVSRRLAHLFDAVGVEVDPADPLAPFTAADLQALGGFQTRDLLVRLQEHRSKCIAAGGWVPLDSDPGPRPDPKPIPPPSDWPQRWNDFRTGHTRPVLGDDAALAGLLGFAADAVSAELPAGRHIGADVAGRFVECEVHAGDAVDKLLVAVCDKSARGGGLENQLDDVARRAGGLPTVFVRSTDFPADTTKVGKKLAALAPAKGVSRKVVVSDSDRRALAAFREFRAAHHADAGFADWQRADRPLSALPAVVRVFALDRMSAVPRPVPPVPPVPPPAVTLPGDAAEVVLTPPPPVRLGVTRSAAPAPVELRPADLRRHAAFLGGSGSGKTTAALLVIEQLLLAGVPAVLLDRKGDLAQYADPAAWDVPEPDPDRAARRNRLRAAVDVRLYTPGADAGRPLAIPVVPADLGRLPANEREAAAQQAAAALGTMMGYKGRNPDPRVVILQKAIEVLGAGPAAVTVKAVRQLVHDQDDALTAAADGFDPKHYRKLAGDLLALAHQHRRLLEGGDPLDVDALLGRGPHAAPGRTRLSVVSTQFLGDDNTTDFWVSQFLLAVDRWRARSPAADGVLQAVFLFDEADRYLPAVRQPASKGPMEGLLKRARSAGVGLLLATQSPGDLDYRCRDQITTWLVGKVKEPTAVAKLRPVLASKPDAADKLAGQGVGEFLLVDEAGVRPVRADRNLVPTAQLPEHRVLAAARG